MKNHYAILNVSSTATYEEIKNAYRKAARLYHPDKQKKHQQQQHQQQLQQHGRDDNNSNKNHTISSTRKRNDNINNNIIFVIDDTSPPPPTTTNANSSFRLIQEAWECLRDTNLRQQYDTSIYNTIQTNELQYKNSIIIYPSDCIEQEYNNNNDNDNDNYDDSSNSNDDIVLLFTCRCGYTINTSELNYDNSCPDDDDYFTHDREQQQQQSSSSSSSSSLRIPIQCSGCSLHYILLLNEDDDE